MTIKLVKDDTRPDWIDGARWVTLYDANGRDWDSPRPYLEFDQTNGRIVIADDYETANDEAARDFVLDKGDVIELAAALLNYALHGTTSTVGCVSQYDVEDRLRRSM